MGLIVDQNGHYRGWLASILCCCAALTEDEYPSERDRNKAAFHSKEAPYHQQPNLTALPSHPITARLSPYDKRETDSLSLHDSRHSDPFNPSKSSNFDPDSLLPQPTTHEADNSHHQLDRSTTNDTTHTVRRIRPSPSGSLHRQNLVPLPLGPVVLRDADNTTTRAELPAWESPNAKIRHQRSESTQDLLSNAGHQSYNHVRETPFQRCGRRSTETLAMRMSPPQSKSQSSFTQRPLVAQATASTPSLSTSFREHARNASNSSTLSTLTERPRNGARLQRKRSNQSKSSIGSPGDSDVEKEVLELNTIVEERRTEGNKRRSGINHIPAVAPSMQVGARSETLNDIGSALSRPLATRTAHSTKAVFEEDSNGRPKSSRSVSRVPGWLSNVTSSGDEPFYNCAADQQQQSRDRAISASSSVTALESVSYTLESSPTTSKRYSRSLMITPLSPVDDCVHGAERGSQVGVAL